jgi:hypothetical protein
MEVDVRRQIKGQTEEAEPVVPNHNFLEQGRCGGIIKTPQIIVNRSIRRTNFLAGFSTIIVNSSVITDKLAATYMSLSQHTAKYTRHVARTPHCKQ